ncbi:type II RES/Xre toxin-antitoxin system antitoxin [Filimonas effusa]|uniref:DUF2384 domain-containing protein n=1 Tax=Filimonas effusa TaxID=2508721 RepID=A0A4Q1D352_9BACT|nr:antitoxin Xre/MbcA/ParS toxin-binding domain-containing protein [Filimonas effusa]RXK82785.1 DUF2384 domain-containing protein [Filimonas effusa]
MRFADISLQKKLDKQIKNMVQQACSDKVYTVQHDQLTFSDFLSNKLLLVCVIRGGVPYAFFDLIQRFTPFDDHYWADFLDISVKSLQRYRQDDRTFKPSLSEKIIEMAEVTNMGLDVFGSMDKFKLWLDTPNYALGSLQPAELLKDSYGKAMVVAELTKINYGILV